MTADEARDALLALYVGNKLPANPTSLYAREAPAAPWNNPRFRFEVGYRLPTGHGVQYVVVGRGLSWERALANARRKIRAQGRPRKPKKNSSTGARRLAQLGLELFATLSLTVPSFKAARPGGALLCRAGADSLVGPLSLVLYGQVQSRTWIDSSAAMLASAAAWARLQPRVRAEAEPFGIERVPLSAPGSRFTFTIPSTPAATFYFVRIEDAAGHPSCPSAVVCFP